MKLRELKPATNDYLWISEDTGHKTERFVFVGKIDELVHATAEFYDCSHEARLEKAYKLAEALKLITQDCGYNVMIEVKS